jgi:hypothetical protein
MRGDTHIGDVMKVCVGYEDDDGREMVAWGFGECIAIDDNGAYTLALIIPKEGEDKLFWERPTEGGQRILIANRDKPQILVVLGWKQGSCSLEDYNKK